MLNEDFRLHAGGSRDTVGLEWIAPADDGVSWVFLNGRVQTDAFAPGTARRSVDIALPDGEAAVLEIHDFAPGEVPDEPPAAVVCPVENFTRPLLTFSAVPGASAYCLHHRPDGEEERKVWDGTGDADADGWIRIPCPVELSGRDAAPGRVGRWHFFRIEAITPYGAPSRGIPRIWRALGIPAPPTIAVEAGSEPGRYTFRLT